MDYKKNAYWLGLAGVVVVILVVYMVIVPPVEAEATAARDVCSGQIATIKEKAEHSAEPNVIKTKDHVAMAEKFKQTVDGQIQSILSEMRTWVIRTPYTDKASASDQEFNKWLSDKRGEFNKLMADAGVEAFPDFYKNLTFDGQGNATDNKSDDLTKRPKYRVWKMTIVEEVLKTLCGKPTTIEVVDFGKEDAELKAPIKREVAAGVTAIKEMAIIDTKAAMSRATSLDGIQKEVLEKIKGRGPSAAYRGVDMPYTYSSVDLKFVAPLSAVTKILKALESTETYHAVITRVDFAREFAPFPKLEDSKERGPSPTANTYFREAPVRVAVSFDIYEYDEAKALALKRAVGLEK